MPAKHRVPLLSIITAAPVEAAVRSLSRQVPKESGNLRSDRPIGRRHERRSRARPRAPIPPRPVSRGAYDYLLGGKDN